MSAADVQAPDDLVELSRSLEVFLAAEAEPDFVAEAHRALACCRHALSRRAQIAEGAVHAAQPLARRHFEEMVADARARADKAFADRRAHYAQRNAEVNP